MALERWLQAEVVQAAQSADDSGKSSGNGRHGGVGKVHFAVDVVAMDFSLEGVLDLSGIAPDNDELAAASEVDDLEALRFQPVRDLLHIVVRGTKAGRELLRR